MRHGAEGRGGLINLIGWRPGLAGPGDRQAEPGRCGGLIGVFRGRGLVSGLAGQGDHERGRRLCGLRRPGPERRGRGVINRGIRGGSGRGQRGRLLIHDHVIHGHRPAGKMTAIPDQKQHRQPQDDQTGQHLDRLVTAAHPYGRLDFGRYCGQFRRHNITEQGHDPLAVGPDQPGITGQIAPGIGRRGNLLVIIFFQRLDDPGVQMQAPGDLRGRQRELFALSAQQAAGRRRGLAFAAGGWRPARHLSDARTAQQAGFG